MIANEAQVYDSERCRELRRRIQAHRIKRLKWSDHTFYFILERKGFGRSLRALNEERLAEFWGMIRGYRKSGLPREFDYDKQGRYMYSLMKRVGWEAMTLRSYLTLHFGKTHWNLLERNERARVIKQLQEILEETEK